MSIITLPLAKEQLKIAAGDTSHDAQLQHFVDGVTGAIEDYKREVIEKRTITERVTLCGRQRFRLCWFLPVISLTSLVSMDGTQVWDVTTASVDIDPDTGIAEVFAPGVPYPSGRAKVVYDAGYAPTAVPEKYVRGALVMLQHVWETQRGAGQQTRGPATGAVGAEEARDVRYMFTFPRKVREWLGAPRPVVG